ncbi:MEX3C ligase, partial [Furnarius figulus]|nr:MEX3C ligase [Furnarius figulus]
GCKIKALRAKTNTYIKTPLRGEQPVFVVTGRPEDVAVARREILSAAEHLSLLRAWRGRASSAGSTPCTPSLPGHTALQLRVPHGVVGLVVGPRGATVKRIQQHTHTYIVTPSRSQEPVFEVWGTPENARRARREIEAHIALRTGSHVLLGHSTDLHCKDTPGTLQGTPTAWTDHSPAPPARPGAVAGQLADPSPTSPFGTGGFWFGEALPSVGTEELGDPTLYDSLPTPPQAIWSPLEPLSPLSCFGGSDPSPPKPPCQGSQPPTPRLSPTFPDSLGQLPLSRRAQGDPWGASPTVGLPLCTPAFSTGTDSCSSSNGGSACSSPPQSQGCVLCLDSEGAAPRVPCTPCAGGVCAHSTPACPLCRAALAQAIH